MNVTVTERAQKKIMAQAARRDFEEFYFRIALQAGGCMGVNQKFDFCEAPSDNDSVLDVGSFKVIVDPKSLKYIEGAELDWTGNLLEHRFSLTFPGRKTQRCSCGTSFSL